MHKVESQSQLADSINNLYDTNSSTSTTDPNQLQLALLEKLNRRDTTNFGRNKAKVCTFWLRGACDRGDLCPFRHENVHKNEALKKQDIKSRYFGTGDVLAEQILKRAEELTKPGAKMLLPTSPDDPTIMTLFIDLNPIFRKAHDDTKLPTKTDITNAITTKFAPYGLLDIRVILPRANNLDQQQNSTALNLNDKPKSSFATVTFQTRQQAENAITGVFNDFSLFGNNSISLNWSNKPPPTLPSHKQQQNHNSIPPPPPLPLQFLNLPFHQQQPLQQSQFQPPPPPPPSQQPQQHQQMPPPPPPQ
jgi:hypothetical protein